MSNPLVEEARRVRDECLKTAPFLRRRFLLERTDWVLNFLGAKDYESIRSELLAELRDFRNEELREDQADKWKPFRIAVVAAAKSLGQSGLDIFAQGVDKK